MKLALLIILLTGLFIYGILLNEWGPDT